MDLYKPTAPKDPEAERPKVWLLYENLVEARPAEGAGFRDICYLEGRVEAKLTSVLPDLDRTLAARLQNCADFCSLVDWVGISATASDPALRNSEMTVTINARLQNGEGILCRGHVPCDGRELRLTPEAAEKEAGETVLSAIVMAFEQYMTARVNITLYLKEGIRVPALTEECPPAFGTERYQDMISRSVLQEGNLDRIARAIERARQGKDVTVAYIGGSITQGAAAKPIGTESYAYRSYRAFADRFGADGGKHVHFVKAGVGGTSSEFGVVRYERDVLRGGSVSPDILVIEFAVNDLGDETEGVSFESLVRKAWNGPGHPAVILLFSVFMDDWNLQERLSPVGVRWNLPMISIRDAVVPQFYEETPVITKRQYFYDLYHPTNEGHRIMADCISLLWDRAEAALQDRAGRMSEADGGETDGADGNPARKEDGGEAAPAIGSWLERIFPVTADTIGQCPDVLSYSAGGFTERDTQLQSVELDDHAYTTPEFDDNWMYCGEGEPFSLTVRAQTVMLVFKDSGDPSFGSAKLYADGQFVREVNPLDTGWTHCNTAILFHENASGIHTVEVRPQQGKNFTILGFGIVRET